jgi:hypothetical protein
MGVGPNYGLSKGFLATGATAYAQFEVVEVLLNTNTSLTSVANAIKRSTTAVAAGDASRLFGVVQEALDTVKLGTGKALLGVELFGLTRVLCGAAVTALDRVTPDTTARVITVAKAAAGAQPKQIVGIALTTTTAAGQYVDVLLTPGATW